MASLLLITALIGVNPGDLMLTRNAGCDEHVNTSPGWWNHAAIYIGNGWVVEAQAGQGVIFTEFNTFCNRYPYIMVMRPRRSCYHTQARMIQSARHMVGRRYDKYASMWLLFFDCNSADNCVSVVRRAFGCGYGFDPAWRKPDDIARDWRLMRVESKGIQ